MVDNLVTQVQKLDSKDVVGFFNYFNQKILNEVDDLRQLKKTISPSVSELPEFSYINSLLVGEQQLQLGESESVAFSRSILETLAQEPSFSPLLEKMLELYNEEMEMSEANPLVSVTLALLTILIVGTTKVSVKNGEIIVEKGEAPTEVLKAMVVPITAASKRQREQEKQEKQRK